MSMLSAIVINGKRFFGSNLQIDVRIDGKRVDFDKMPKIDIVVHGNLAALEVGAANSVEVQGAVGTLRTGSGDVACGEVRGDLSTGSGDIKCGSVQGSITTGSGDVDCGQVGGDVTTSSGDITTRRV
ncbi:hypothetical protein KTD31_00505 [Burkholderia multivorans]|uniref:hypothetical protein n=1 Tax=Burkholderia multivorans TaxID=87883 RepID=UPI001C2253E7|nr:hypothetical protein [Burkholderia multivorans]MBU9199880.1 hypothetical protein [Burkholderia multivorans]MDN8079001.1 hypothetical protein [Burkholderia multivorans]